MPVEYISEGEALKVVTSLLEISRVDLKNLGPHVTLFEGFGLSRWLDVYNLPDKIRIDKNVYDRIGVGYFRQGYLADGPMPMYSLWLIDYRGNIKQLEFKDLIKIKQNKLKT